MSRSFYKKRYKSAIVLKFFDSVYKSLQVIDGEEHETIRQASFDPNIMTWG